MLIVKLLICICILEITTYIGLMLGRELKNRTNEYVKLQSICNYIEGRIKYSQDNLIDIFEDVCKENKDNNFGVLFKEITYEMKKNIYSLNECISRAISNNKYRFSLDFSILLELSNNLGKSNVENQIKAIELAKERIVEKITESRVIESKNTKLYRNLGVICGIMLVIVLI